MHNLFAQPPKQPTATATTQEITGKDRLQLLTTARSQYYNLRAAGVESYGCNIAIDWPAIFKQFSPGGLPATDPTLLYLQSSRLSFSTDLTDRPTVKWAFTGVAPEGKADAASQMTSGMAETVKGFLKAFSPSQNGSLISLAPRTFKHTAAGFEIEDSSGSNLDLLSLNHDMVLSHSVTKTDSLMAESDWAFTSSAKGLLLSKLMVESHSPPTAPSTRVTMTAAYAPVDSFLLPQDVTFAVENVATFNLKFTDCLVTHPTATP